jgi:tRNA (guanine37-N1)-methyltransferase
MAATGAQPSIDSDGDRPVGLAPLATRSIAVFTLFPSLITTFAATSVLGRASKNDLLTIVAHDLRSHGQGVHQTVDDAPYGGGAGMVLTPQAVFDCVEAAQPPRPVFALGPGGRRFDQAFAHELARQVLDGGFSLLCGRYEGFDERVHDHLTDGEISLGDFVLGGGEVAAMAVIEAVGRLIPGVMGNDASAGEESFADDLLEYPQYTRPVSFRGWDVPAVLRSGDHAKVARWRLAASVLRTANDRPDLLTKRGGVKANERRALHEFDMLDALPQPWGELAREEQALEDEAAAAKKRRRQRPGTTAP